MKSDTYANEYLAHLLQNADVALIGDATGLRGSSTAGSLYLSAHTADPSAGTQETNECAYTGYGRVAVARTAGGWDVTGRVGSNVAELLFGLCTASPGSPITHLGIGTASSGAGKLLEVLTLAAPLTVVVGTRPRIGAGDATITA